MCIVFHIQLELNTALGIDLVNSNLSCILYCIAVNSCGAGEGAGASNLDLSARICRIFSRCSASG